MSSNRRLVIGVGNQYRGDDAVGLVVAKRLQGLDLPDVDVKLIPEGGLSLIAAWQGANSVIIVDAVRGASVAGTIVRIDQQQLEQRSDIGTVSSHGFGIGESTRMARALGSLPPRLIIYGIEAMSFEAGSPLTPEVAEAVEQAVQLIAEELKCTSLA